MRRERSGWSLIVVAILGLANDALAQAGPSVRIIPMDQASLTATSCSLEQPAVSPQPPKRRRLAISIQTGQPSSGPAHDLEDLQYKVSTTGVLVSRNYQFVRFGGGPALHKAGVRKNPGSEPDPASRTSSWASDSHLGLIGVAGIRVPTETRIYLDFNFQYRYLALTRFGPFTPTCCSSPATTLPAFPAQFSHWFLAFGPGIRF